MPAKLHSYSVPVNTLRRGFWLYILTVRIDGENWHYVGRTGDNGHLTACDPFSRLAMHIRTGKADSIIDKYNKVNRIDQIGLSVSDIKSVDFDCYGPVIEGADGNRVEHHERRKRIAPLENTLIKSMRDAGYNVLNKPGRDRNYDEGLWFDVKATFSTKFEKLSNVSP